VPRSEDTIQAKGSVKESEGWKSRWDAKPR